LPLGASDAEAEGAADGAAEALVGGAAEPTLADGVGVDVDFSLQLSQPASTVSGRTSSRTVDRTWTSRRESFGPMLAQIASEITGLVTSLKQVTRLHSGWE
jgi:hypothetical protein